jgi:hypothetical protein
MASSLIEIRGMVSNVAKSLCDTCKFCDKKNMMTCSKFGCSKIDNMVKVCLYYKQEKGK